MRLGMAIDLDKCVGCKGCQVACKEWNTSGLSGPLPDLDPYGSHPEGVWFKRVYSLEAGAYPATSVLYFPKACMHCDAPPCVEVCPTGASHRRDDNGLVLVDTRVCVGCQLCTWACPYGAREFDPVEKVVKKCTFCVDRIGNESLAPEERLPACVLNCPTRAGVFGDLDDPHSELAKVIVARGGIPLLPEQGTGPAVYYLPRRNIPAREVRAAQG